MVLPSLERPGSGRASERRVLGLTSRGMITSSNGGNTVVRMAFVPELVVCENSEPDESDCDLLRASAAGSRVSSEVCPGTREARLRRMVDEYIDFVARVLRNAGSPEAELDDDVQRTFITVARRLDDVRPGAEKSFLLQIALRVAAHSRRTLARRREVGAPEALEAMQSLSTPEHLVDQKKLRQLLDHVLDGMEGTLRTVFVLYEFEEMNMAEIARVLGIPRGTVASRLRRARVTFRERIRALEGLMQAEVRS